MLTYSHFFSKPIRGLNRKNGEDLVMFYNYRLTFELNRMVDIYEHEFKFTILRRALESINDTRLSLYNGVKRS